VITAGTNTSVSGDGSSTQPYTVSVSCEAIQDCIGAILGQGLTYNDPSNLISAKVSSQSGNQLSFGPDNGLYVPAATSYETPLTADFTHTIAAAANTYEKITELADLNIAEAGTYLVQYSARVVAAIPTGTAAVNTGTVMALHRNNVLVPNTESRGALVSQGLASTSEPVLQVQGTAASQCIVVCAANDKLSLYGKRSSSTAGTVNSVNNDDGGRVKITAVRIRL
jgi:hypothetical protein